MISKKIVLLCSTILSGCVREFQSTFIKLDKGKKLIANNPKGKSTITTECYCIPKVSLGKRVSEHITPAGQHLDRLVIYVYRNKNNEIKIYVPNREKQSFLPDLTFEEGDKLESLGTKSIIEIFNIYRSTVIPSHEVKESIWQKELTGYLLSDINQSRPQGPIDLGNTQGLTYKPYLPDGGGLIKDQIVITLPSKPSVPWRPPTINQKENVGNSQFVIPGQQYTGNIAISDGITQVPGTPYSVVESEIEVFKPFPSTSSEITPVPQKNYNQMDILMLQGYDQGSIIKLTKQPKFNQWLEDQLKLIWKKKPSTTNLINIKHFKILLLKILVQNGIIISSLSNVGKLQDSQGNVFDITNLKLRPILLGDPMTYSKLISANKCVIPSNLPFSEAVLVTLVYPSKILGIIPLGRLSQTSNGIRLPCNAKPCDENCKIQQRSHLNENAYQIDLVKNNDDIINVSENESESLNDDRSVNVDSNVQNQNIFGNMYNRRHLNVRSKDNVTIEDVESVKSMKIPENVQIYNMDDVDDSLGIRIIGGQPATSSGTPVSNKGRSASIIFID